MSADQLYKLNPVTGYVSQTLLLPATDPRGVAWDGANLWVLTSANRTIYKLNPTNGAGVGGLSSPGSVALGACLGRRPHLAERRYRRRYLSVQPGNNHESIGGARLVDRSDNVG